MREQIIKEFQLVWRSLEAQGVLPSSQETKSVSRETLFAGEQDSKVVERLEAYLLKLDHWTKTVDLVSPAPLEVLLQRHLVDCFAPYLIAKFRIPALSAAPILDVGSGAGLPGLIWAILDPQLRMELCEPRKKRVVFLQEVVRALSLENVVLLPQEMELIEERRYGVMVCRALGQEQLFLESGARLLLPHGLCLAMVGPSWELDSGFSLASLEFLGKVEYSLGDDGPRRGIAMWQSVSRETLLL